MSETHNGWTNYETWVVALWMDNDQWSYTEAREWAREALHEHDTAPTIHLADVLKDEHTCRAPDLEGVYSDLLTASLGEVNWFEIAANLIEEVRGYEEALGGPSEDSNTCPDCGRDRYSGAPCKNLPTGEDSHLEADYEDRFLVDD
jgi:hypothetical protein